PCEQRFGEVRRCLGSESPCDECTNRFVRFVTAACDEDFAGHPKPATPRKQSSAEKRSNPCWNSENRRGGERMQLAAPLDVGKAWGVCGGQRGRQAEVLAQGDAVRLFNQQ